MSEHVTTLESLELRLTAFEARWEATIPHLATKADMEALRGDMQKWMLGTVIALFFGIGALILSISNRFDASDAKPAPPPVIYYLPAPQAPPLRAP